jgi:hypothetical protein
MTANLRRAAALLTAWLALPVAASAQVITNGEIERGLRPGPRMPYDGSPQTLRYNYDLGGAFFYLGGSGRQLSYLEYLDRVDRAERFGYRMPPNPYRQRIVVHPYPCEPQPGVIILEGPPPGPAPSVYPSPAYRR